MIFKEKNDLDQAIISAKAELKICKIELNKCNDKISLFKSQAKNFEEQVS